MEPRTPDWASLFFSQWPLYPANLTGSVWSQILVSSSRSSSSLQLAESQPEGLTREDCSDPVQDTQSFLAVSASSGKAGTRHWTEHTLPLLLLFSLCVLRVAMAPAQITTTSSRFDSETERELLVPSSLVSAHPLGSLSLWGASTRFCARKFPLALWSILQFSFTVGVLPDKDCVYMLYMLRES